MFIYLFIEHLFFSVFFFIYKSVRIGPRYFRSHNKLTPIKWLYTPSGGPPPNLRTTELTLDQCCVLDSACVPLVIIKITSAWLWLTGLFVCTFPNYLKYFTFSPTSCAPCVVIRLIMRWWSKQSAHLWFMAFTVWMHLNSNLIHLAIAYNVRKPYHILVRAWRLLYPSLCCFKWRFVWFWTDGQTSHWTAIVMDFFFLD